jgi:hypothetical protein
MADFSQEKGQAMKLIATLRLVSVGAVLPLGAPTFFSRVVFLSGQDLDLLINLPPVG